METMIERIKKAYLLAAEIIAEIDFKILEKIQTIIIRQFYSDMKLGLIKDLECPKVSYFIFNDLPKEILAMNDNGMEILSVPYDMLDWGDGKIDDYFAKKSIDKAKIRDLADKAIAELRVPFTIQIQSVLDRFNTQN